MASYSPIPTDSYNYFLKGDVARHTRTRYSSTIMLWCRIPNNRYRIPNNQALLTTYTCLLLYCNCATYSSTPSRLRNADTADRKTDNSYE